MNILKEEINRYKDLMNIKSSLNEGTFMAPLAGSVYVTSPFGKQRSYEKHPGVDLRAKSGTQILSPADGVVELADSNNNPKCGGTVDVKFNDGLWGRFCHVKAIYKKKGDPVSQGDVLGLSGGDSRDPGRGNSKDAHIHFTLKKDGRLVDPMDYIGKARITTGEPKVNNTQTTQTTQTNQIQSDIPELNKILNLDFGGKKIKDILSMDKISNEPDDFFDIIKKFLSTISND
jgi:hypothetical protein